MQPTFWLKVIEIRDQAAIFEGLDERAVELGVILPLLRRAGWNTEDITQIYPQRLLTNGGKVDYDLQIRGESRIFIEAKRWNHSLTDEDEDQLRDYCLLGKPSLAVLTNGRQWKLYLPPLQPRNKAEKPRIRQFLVFDIADDEPKDVEKNFERFLARDRMLWRGTLQKTVDDAITLFNEKQNHAAVMKGLADAWNELATDRQALANVMTHIAASHGIRTDTSQVEQFLHSKGPLVNPVSDSSGRKSQKSPIPVSFAFHLGGEKPTVKSVKRGWNQLVIDLCLLMRERHPQDFSDVLLTMPEWFSKSKTDLKAPRPIGDTGIWLKHGSTHEIKQTIPLLVAKFGYPPDSLTIEEK